LIISGLNLDANQWASGYCGEFACALKHKDERLAQETGSEGGDLFSNVVQE